ncbi:MAG: adenylyltransferase [Thaumarchaeota archaeon]|nr:MAG: adenylyltransferase [Nitrososphaerota archaeon]
MTVGLTNEELARYDRQLKVPTFGVNEQIKLKQASILIAGVGGLGSAAAYYLVAAGVGKVKLVDEGRIELSNLNRQILYSTNDLGKLKVTVASRRLRDLNPEVDIVGISEKISESTINGLLKDIDLVIDGQDNFKTRFLINEECVKKKIPLIHAAVYGFEGRLMTIIPYKGPCLRCLLPEPPPEPPIVPVMAPTPGILGALQALEAIKVLAGVGEPAIGKLIIVDGRELSFYTINVEKDPECPICGEKKVDD